ncbi:MAG: hypothetical protein ABIH20_06830 [Candidatus Diapherotrites archaeon]
MIHIESNKIIYTMAIIAFIPILIVCAGFIQNADSFASADLSSNIVNLFFLEKYGYLENAAEWQNGNYLALSFYFPLSFFFALPIYKLLLFFSVPNALSLSGFAVMLLSVIFLLFIAKKEFASLSLGIIFLSLAFFNKISINTFFETQRMATIFAWIFFLAFMFKCFRIFNKKEFSFKDAVFVGLTWSLSVMAYAHFLLYGLFVFPFILLINKFDFKKIGIVAFLVSLNLIWIIPAFSSYSDSAISIMSWFSNIPLTFFAFSLLVLSALIYFSFSEKNEVTKKFLKFNALIFAFIVSGVSSFIPVLNKFMFTLYLQYFTVVAVYFLIMKILSSDKKVLYSVFLVVLASSAYSAVYFSDFSDRANFNNTICKEADGIAEDIIEPYMFIGDSKGCYISGYLAAQHGKVTLFDGLSYSLPIHLYESYNEIKTEIEVDCDSTVKLMKKLKAGSVICTNEFCEKLNCIETIASTENLQVKSLNN